jgi:hypothetical protein
VFGTLAVVVGVILMVEADTEFFRHHHHQSEAY